MCNNNNTALIGMYSRHIKWGSETFLYHVRDWIYVEKSSGGKCGMCVRVLIVVMLVLQYFCVN